MKKHGLKIFLSVLTLLIGVGFFVFAKKLDVPKITHAFNSFPVAVLVGACLCSGAQVFFMGLRFWALLPTGYPPLKALRAIVFGHLANSFAPARAGEALKIVLLSQGKEGIPVLTATGTFACEKLIDIATLAFLALVFKSYASPVFQFPIPKGSWTMAIGIFAGVVGIYFLGRFLKSRWKGIKSNLLVDLKVGLHALHYPKKALLSTAFGLLCWASEVFAVELLLRAQGMNLTVGEIIAVICVLNIGISVAISVANLGTFEAAFVYALTKMGCPPETAIAVALCHHALQLISIVGLSAVLAIGNWDELRKKPIQPSLVP